MELNADFSRPARADLATIPWEASPQPGVSRRMLDRIGDEVARATSVVRFEPGATFPHHVHELGEEFLILSGTFQDTSGDYPAGTYARHPPGSSHAPWSTDGCELLVKLRQFEPHDLSWVKLDTAGKENWTEEPTGLRRMPLHRFGSERVSSVEIPPGTTASEVCPGGAELLVIEGAVQVNGAQLRAGCWLRLPAGAQLALNGTDAQSARIWLKEGHLAA